MDLTFIGSGISTSFTLIPLLKQLSYKKHLKIAIVEKHPEPHTGIAYGPRSGSSALLITSLADFLPPGEEREEFIDWLSKNKTKLIHDLRISGGELSEKWIQTHHDEIEKDDWSEIYIPRRFFGTYIKQKTQIAIDQFNTSNEVKINYINDEALDIAPSANGYQIKFKNSESLESSRVVISVGIPPISQMWNASEAKTHENMACLISNPYNPSLDRTLLKIQNFVNQSQRKSRVLIIGANASAMEMIYKLNDVVSIKNKIANYHVLSPQGELPNSAKDFRSAEFVPRNLLGLSRENNLTALQIYEAANKDLDVAESLNYGTAISEVPVSRAFTSLLYKLSTHELTEFACHYGNEIGKRQRRAGKHYTDVVDGLRKEKRLTNIKGYFTGIEESPAHDGAIFQYKKEKENTSQTFEMSVDIIINCMGSKSLDVKNISPLIDSLIFKKLAVPNDSQRGFLVNSTFETSKNLYIIGPLLAGNLINNLPLWHIEHCGRIIYLGKTLANHLSESLKS